MLRRRAAQGMVVIVVLAAAPLIVARIWPSAAHYVPPTLLSLFIAMSLLSAFMTWRTESFVRFLGGSDQPPESLANFSKQIKRQRVLTVFTIIFTVIFAVPWVKSIL